MQKRLFHHVLCRTLLLCLFIIFVACLTPISQSTAAPPTEADGASLMEERCSTCHSLDRIKQAKKTRDQWVQTVKSMVGKGAQLSATEQSSVIDYLSKTYGP
jgi:hypothetical protein